MSDPAERPQIGPLDVEREVLDLPGESWERLTATLGLAAGDGVGDAPRAGWRVLHEDPSGALAIGAPADERGRDWRVAWVDPPREGASSRPVNVHPEMQQLRRSRAERSRGLVLRWPAVAADDVDHGVFVIDIVNTGDAVWRPDGDDFLVVGTITAPGQSDLTFGYAAIAVQNPAVALAPGDYARVRVAIGESRWHELTPGDYELHALLGSLAVRTRAPLPLQVTSDHLERFARHRAARRRPSPRHEEFIAQRRAQLTAFELARPLIGAIAEATASAPTIADAGSAIQGLLDCDPPTANTVLHARLIDFTAEGLDAERRSIEQLTGRRERA